MESLKNYIANSHGELTVTKNGWFYPCWSLTDGVNIYGELSYTGNWKRKGLIKTAGLNWLICPKGIFSRTLLVNEQSSGQTVAAITTTPWKGRVTIEFIDGRIFCLKRQGIFSRINFWQNEQNGDTLTIESKRFSYKQPFIINPGVMQFKNDAELAILSFAGIYIILRRNEQAAATH